VYKRRESFLEMNVNSLVCSLNCIFYFSVKTFRLNAREFTKKKIKHFFSTSIFCLFIYSVYGTIIYF